MKEVSVYLERTMVIPVAIMDGKTPVKVTIKHGDVEMKVDLTENQMFPAGDVVNVSADVADELARSGAARNHNVSLDNWSALN